ncbi:unnamed protein product, partial [Larinioides sclopetarius]
INKNDTTIENIAFAVFRHSFESFIFYNFVSDYNMDRAAEFMNSLIVPRSLRGVIREYIISRRSGYQEIGSESDASCWIKLIIYLGSAVTIILSIVAFAYGYVILPAISTSVAVVCVALFWFRNSCIWVGLLECSRTVFCFPCNYFKKPIPPEAEIRHERRLRQLLFGRSVEVQTDSLEERAEAPSPSTEASSESESSITIDTKPVKLQNASEK